MDIPFQTAKHPFSLVIFGASGSLAKLKLFPAIYELAKERRVPEDFCVVGYGRTPMTQSAFRKLFEKSIRSTEPHVDTAIMTKLLEKISYVSGEYKQKSDFQKLLEHLQSIELGKKRIRMAYFSVPPSAFEDIFSQLALVNFKTPLSDLRLIIEKPFGYDLKSAKNLKAQLDKHFKPEQIFLLDHYLGKEAVSNLLSLRYANSILSTLLHHEHIASIQISAMEDRDIEGRANYFDQVGVLRDMVQSHLLQILAYFTMLAPRKRTLESIHEEKCKILRDVEIRDPKADIIRGQYKGYLKEEGVPKGSQTETYVALKVHLDHHLWRDIPIYLRSGKALKNKWTGVVVEFKPKWPQEEMGKIPPNRLVIQLQPTEKIEFHLLTKLGGKLLDFHEMNTGRPIYCSGDCLVEHGRLLLDVVEGKRDLFLDFEEIFAAWKVIDPLQKVCDRFRKKSCEMHFYEKGTLGPAAADRWIKEDGFQWFNPKT